MQWQLTWGSGVVLVVVPGSGVVVAPAFEQLQSGVVVVGPVVVVLVVVEVMVLVLVVVPGPQPSLA